LSNSTESFSLRNIHRSEKDPFNIIIKNEDKLVYIHAYCLMPNHYHFVISSKVKDGITHFMQKLGTAYCMYFNKKYERTGSLFEGKFKAKHADTDEYLKYLFSYIHMNPLALKDEDLHANPLQDTRNNFDYLTTYKYSSLADYVRNERKEKVIIDTTMYEEYLPSHNNIYTELQDWLEFEYAT